MIIFTSSNFAIIVAAIKFEMGFSTNHDNFFFWDISITFSFALLLSVTLSPMHNYFRLCMLWLFELFFGYENRVTRTDNRHMLTVSICLERYTLNSISQFFFFSLFFYFRCWFFIQFTLSTAYSFWYFRFEFHLLDIDIVSSDKTLRSVCMRHTEIIRKKKYMNSLVEMVLNW